MGYSVAIDGPAGAGKSTIAREIAKKMNFIYVDTGAMYRAMALYLLRNGIKPEEKEKIEEYCQRADISIAYEKGEQVVLLNGENVNPLIRTEEVGKMASATSGNGMVRKKLVALQQKLAASKEVIMDGRDIGTCVLPRANVKIYLTASSRVRAKRRFDELSARGIGCNMEEIEADIIERDKQDMGREISPLRQAEDAILVDTSEMTIEQVLDTLIGLIHKERRVVKAKSAGFCFGVKKAMETVYQQIEQAQDKPIYTFGPLIHNEEVVKELAEKGVRVIEGKENLEKLKEGTVIIRSHGVSKEIYRIIEKNRLSCVDATCPFVKRIHHIVEKESQQGKRIVIIGNDGHPEVEGIKGWCSSPATVLENTKEAENFTCKEGEKICIVSQTTFNYNKFKDLVEIFQKKGYDISVVNTICNATEERQTEAKEIAAKADAMIVIGGTHSSNTRKLYEICKNECENTHFIQTLDDLHLDLPKSVGLVGITAGASTPNNIIEEVQNYVRINF